MYGSLLRDSPGCSLWDVCLIYSLIAFEPEESLKLTTCRRLCVFKIMINKDHIGRMDSSSWVFSLKPETR